MKCIYSVYLWQFVLIFIPFSICFKSTWDILWVKYFKKLYQYLSSYLGLGGAIGTVKCDVHAEVRWIYAEVRRSFAEVRLLNLKFEYCDVFKYNVIRQKGFVGRIINLCICRFHAYIGKETERHKQFKFRTCSFKRYK